MVFRKKKCDSEAVKMSMKITIEGKRGRGRPRKRRIDRIENDMKITGVGKEVKDYRALSR